jgi:fructose-specific phosphotransferase system IIC component
MEINKTDLIFSGIIFGVIGGFIGHHHEIGVVSGMAAGIVAGLVLCFFIEIIKVWLDDVVFDNRQKDE